MKIRLFIVAAAGLSCFAQAPAAPPAPEPAPAPLTARIWGGLDVGFQVSVRVSERGERDRAERDYERGTRALDKRQWDEAAQHFSEVVNLGGTKADGALYWKAYALAKLGRSSEALATLDTLAQAHARSRWLNDAKALRVEIGQAAGRPIAPEDTGDDDLKLIAINTLMRSDPERSVPLLEKLLVGRSSPKLRERALFVLSQSDSPKAREVVARVAKGESNPDLQMRAVQNLGAYGGKENLQLLSEIYSSSNEIGVKKQVLRSFMVSGQRDRLLAVAKSDPNVELRADAVRWLGNMGSSNQLSELYASEASPDVRESILRAMLASNNTEKLIEIAKAEKDDRLRERAIQYLGGSPSPAVSEALVSIYSASSDMRVKARVLRALASQGNTKQIIELARKESNPEVKKVAVQHLSNVKSKEATDFLMEILSK